MNSAKVSHKESAGARWGLSRKAFRGWCLWISRVSISDDDNTSESAVKNPRICMWKITSHTNYITSSSIIDIASFGTDEMTESLVPKNINITSLIIM